MLNGRTDGEALVLWPPYANSRFIGGDLDTRKDLKQEKRVTEDETVG